MFLALLTLPPLFVAVILHEIAHGLVAERLGDPTARQLGRITLNPLKHIDPWMTIMLPLLLLLLHSPVIFGGAKPVPIDPSYFKDPRRGMLWVAIAGPITNFILAMLCLILLNLLFPGGLDAEAGIVRSTIAGWLSFGLLINLVLGLFNLTPIPPLDGGRVVTGLLPLPLARRYAKIEPFGLVIVMALLLSGALDKVLRPLLEFALSAIEKLSI